MACIDGVFCSNVEVVFLFTYSKVCLDLLFAVYTYIHIYRYIVHEFVVDHMYSIHTYVKLLTSN